MPFSLLLDNNTLSYATVAFIRVAYGSLLLLTLLSLLPSARRFFISEQWRGYSEATRRNNLLQNPIASAFIIALWVSCALCLLQGVFVLPAAAVNVVICHYFCIGMRWQSISRGLGAPGFMSFWLGLALFVMELTMNYAPRVASLALLTFQVDFALIMLSAGLYKMKAGYAHNEGMEYGMVNPQWGYWSNFFKDNFSPTNPIFKILNHLAWSLEVIGAILMVVPSTRLLGALVILVSFAFIATQIRLGVLCEVVMVCCFLFATTRSIVDRFLVATMPPNPVAQSIGLPGLELVLGSLLFAYLILTPLAHGGLFYNLFRKKPLPGVLQGLLERYTNTFGIIIWRVFSADLTNFFIRIYCHHQDAPFTAGDLVIRWGWNGNWRFNHVCESITLTSLFTTRKYHPDNLLMFHSRLVRYARTLSCPQDSVLTFEYVAIKKTQERFVYEPKTLFAVNPATGVVVETAIDESFSVAAPHAHSPVSAGARPGSYVPINR